MDNPAEKQDKPLPPGLALNGPLIKGIREEKKLTQLYVASVVGVTVDTISRWENNRYPNIKRENAEKLAVALEVDLADIVKDDGEPEPETPTAKNTGTKKGVIFAAALSVLSLLIAAAFIILRPSPQPIAERILPPFGAPGETVPVQIRVTRKGALDAGFIVKERLPDGWRLVTSNPPAIKPDDSSSEVKWLIPAGREQIAIYYTAMIDAGEALQREAEFLGSIVYLDDGRTQSEPISGNSRIKVAEIHWADRNGDGRIDDDEIMPAYYLTEEMKGLGLDWKTIEAIWNAGGYKWDSRRGVFVVLK